MTWMQAYTPVGGSLLWSSLVAAIPIVVLLGLLGWFHMRAHAAALIGLASALILAIFVYGMPAKLAAMSALYGAAFGLLPIGWIVLCAIFVYDITVYTGQFDVIKRTIGHLADDRRVQVLLIAFSFGAFIEGAAGFGTPVAISAAMMIGLGFRPLAAAGLALIGNTAPVAFGGLGTPIITLASVTGLDMLQLSAMAGRQLPFFSVIIPFWLIWAMAGWRAMWEVWPACLAAGLSFGVVQFVVSNYHGPWVVDIAGGLASILCMIALLRFWKPKRSWRFDHETADSDAASTEAESVPPVTARQAVIAWAPWVLLSLTVFVWGLPGVKAALDKPTTSEEIPALHMSVLRGPPVVREIEPEKAVFRFNWLSATGTGLLASGIVSGLLLRIPPLTLLKLFGHTVRRMRVSLLTIAAMLALGYVTRYAGIDATLGLAFASTGVLFPFFSPLLGWLGVALTGSDTASNVLFGNLQRITAERLNLSPILAAASNSSGGVMGKMIDAQSIVVAGVATGQHGKEGEILRYVLFHSIALAVLVGILVWLQAHVLTWMIP
jgi:lactate permease